jgi:hypothetical protein
MAAALGLLVLVGLTMLSAVQTIQRPVVKLLMNNSLGRMCKELAVT